ncbi:condensation domain-containing protein [Bacillus paranthracis]|uniref:condensation domain-containing protein n=1 Tax=Bacillus paranthracis TaxID=2026186 RepID=UPI00298CA8C4|nr:condensation domain-containing protein [Bacillus paranthracis]
MSLEKDLYSLSSGEQAIWFESKIRENTNHYNEAGIIEFNIEINVKAFSDAVNELLKNNSVLRTRIIDIDGEPFQYIEDYIYVDVPVYDLSHYEENKKSEEIDKILNNESQYKFNMEKETMVRFCLIKVEKEKYIMTFVIHHIIADGTTAGLIVNDLSVNYNSIISLNEIPKAKKKIEFREFVEKEQDWLNSPKAEKQLQYWRDILYGCNPYLNLPLDYPRPPVKSFKGKKNKYEITEENFETINNFLENQNVSLYVVLLVGLNTLLYYYSDQEDILIGCPVANRSWGNKYSYGHFANAVIQRTNFKNNPTFNELLQEKKRSVLKAVTNHKIPLDKVLADWKLQNPRNNNYSPFIQVMLTSLSNVYSPTFNFGGIEHNGYLIDTHSSKFDLDLSVQMLEDKITVQIEYDTDLFKNSTINTMFNDYVSIILCLIEEPDRRISATLDLFSEEKYDSLDCIF